MNYFVRRNFAHGHVGAKVGIQYSFNAILEMLTVPLSLIIYYFLWKSIFLYTGVTTIHGFTFIGMVHYYALSMIVGFFTFSEVEKWMEEDIRRGYMIRLMLKPASLLAQYLLFEVGLNMISITLQIIPVFIIGFLFFNLPVASVPVWITFALTTILAFFLVFFFNYLIGLSAFWLHRITGIRRIKQVLIIFLSGGMIPLVFFPQSIQHVLAYSPFPYMRSFPITIYLTKLSSAELLRALAIQVIWILILGIIISIVWKRAYKKFCGVGT